MATDTTPPTIAVTSNKTALKAGDTALITFTLSEPAVDFVLSDVVVSGGTLSNFSGSGTSYTSIFTPAMNSTAAGSVSVGSFKFSDQTENANEDGADANNQVSIVIDTVPPTLSITTNKTNLGFGEIANITFTLSEPSNSFNIYDLSLFRAKIEDFQGAGRIYTASLIPTTSTAATISVGIGEFSDSIGNLNQNAVKLSVIPYDPRGANLLWTKILGTEGWDYSTGITAGRDGFIYVSGNTKGNLDGQSIIGSQDVFISKYNSDGLRLWTKLLGSAGGDEDPKIVSGPDKSIYLAYWRGISDAFVARLNADGNELWSNQFGTSLNDSARDLAAGNDGALYVTGYTQGNLDSQLNSGGSGDAYITKFKSDGTKDWTKLLGSSSFDEAYAVTISSDDSIYVAGRTDGSLDGQTNSGFSDAFVTKYNSDGIKVWTRLLGSADVEIANALASGKDGSIYVAGYTSGNLEGQINSGGLDAFISKFNADGTRVWTKLLGSKYSDIAYSLTVGDDGSIYVGGFVSGDIEGQSHAGMEDAFIAKFNYDGGRDWIKLMGSSESDSVRALTIGAEGSLYVSGSTKGNFDSQTNNGQFDAFLSKFSLPDLSSPTISLAVDKSSLKIGETANLNFTLSKPSVNFVALDITALGGTITNFSGSGLNYTALFAASVDGLTGASVVVGSGKFSDALGQFNEDGADADNKMSFTVATPTYGMTALGTSVNEGGSATFSLVTTNIASGFPLPYTVSGVSAADITNGVLTGTVTVDSNGKATITVTVAGDEITEGDETLTVTVQGQSASVTIKDTSVGAISVANFQGMAYHWKSHVLLSGVNVSVGSAAAVQANAEELFDLRGARFEASTGTLIVEVWANASANFGNFDFRAATAGATAASFTSALPEGWTVTAGTSNPQSVLVSAISLGNLTGSVKLGTLQITLPANSTTAEVAFSQIKVGNIEGANQGLAMQGRTTAGDGAYSFTSLGSQALQMVASRSTADVGNAVTSADALAALRIAVGLNPNPDPDGASGPKTAPAISPYQIMAADVNGSGTVTSADALAILRMAVKLSTALPQEWFFVEETRDFWDEAANGGQGAFTLNRGNANWDRSIPVPAEGGTVNLVGILKGDVNGSWAAPAGSTDLDVTDPTYFQRLAQLLGQPSVDQWGGPPPGP